MCHRSPIPRAVLAFLAVLVAIDVPAQTLDTTLRADRADAQPRPFTVGVSLGGGVVTSLHHSMIFANEKADFPGYELAAGIVAELAIVGPSSLTGRVIYGECRARRSIDWDDGDRLRLYPGETWYFRSIGTLRNHYVEACLLYVHRIESGIASLGGVIGPGLGTLISSNYHQTDEILSPADAHFTDSLRRNRGRVLVFDEAGSGDAGLYPFVAAGVEAMLRPIGWRWSVGVGLFYEANVGAKPDWNVIRVRALLDIRWSP